MSLRSAPTAQEKTTSGTLEALFAMTALTSLAICALASLFPSHLIQHPAAIYSLVFVGTVLLVTWISLLLTHIWRMIFSRKVRYSLGWVLVVLFLPIIGPALASLRNSQGGG